MKRPPQVSGSVQSIGMADESANAEVPLLLKASSRCRLPLALPFFGLSSWLTFCLLFSHRLLRSHNSAFFSPRLERGSNWRRRSQSHNFTNADLQLPLLPYVDLSSHLFPNADLSLPDANFPPLLSKPTLIQTFPPLFSSPHANFPFPPICSF